jgi:ACS family hexuronate transporter-like MFS transporter
MANNNLRWWIAGLLALATALNYLDRQSFPVVVGEVRKEIPISDEEYGRIISLFLLAYGVMYAGGGRMLDVLGTRIGYATMIVWWSAANGLTGMVSSVLGLGVARFLLGMGEGGGFPGSAKAVAEWFPPKERSLAFGIFNTGSSVGAVIAPLLIPPLVAAYGWRSVFFITGGLGFVWAAIWFWLYRTPNQSLKAEERVDIAVVLGSTGDKRTGAPPPWLQLFTYGEVWGLMTAKFLTDAAWYFFIFWLPKYLGDVRHLNIKEIGYFAWIPYAFAGAGSLTGGWLGGYLLRRGFSLDRSRKVALAVGALLLPSSLFIATSPLSLAIVFYSAAMFAHQFWSANVQTMPADLFPARVVGSVEGLLGAAGSFGGILFGLLVGGLIAQHGYGPAFLVAGMMHPLALAVILASVKRIALIPLSTTASDSPS